MIHESSVIDPKAKISKNTKIGPFCYIGPNVQLDENVELDTWIMSNSKQYIDYVTATKDGLQTSDPVRRANTTISFDRTNYLLTESAWDVANVSLESSIGYNIANLSVQTKQEVSANASVRAADKLFKFDAEVQAQFIAEVNTYYNDVTAARNTEIVGNGTVMAGLVTSGQLKNTLALIKENIVLTMMGF